MDDLIKTTITILRPGMPEVQESYHLRADPGLSRLRALVEPLLDGGGLERVRVFHDRRYTDMFVDEDSVEKGLPVNAAATVIYRCNVLTHDKRARAEDLPAVYGPAVLFSRPVWF